MWVRESWQQLAVWEIDKVGAVVVMVNIVVEIIKRLRREEVDGSQLEWAVNKSKRNVKTMSGQQRLIQVTNRLCTHDVAVGWRAPLS